jgi:TP901 family phage tail tape measure protein
VAARILNKVQKEIANVYQNILKLNEAMTDIRIVTGASVDEANSLMTSYNKLAKELGTTTTEVAKSASEWMRQGYSVSESVNLITASVKLARLGFMDMGSATTSLTAVLKGFNLQATESSKIVDKLTKLDAEYATTAGDIATALSRTAAVAKSANLDLDQTAAMLTTIIDITQQDAGSVGNALRTILSRYGNVKAGVFSGMAEDGEDTSESLNDVEKVLNAIGI